MTFDNSKTIISLRIKFFFATIFLLGYVALAYVARLIKFPLLGLSDTIWTLFFVVIFLFVAFSPMVLNYQFIYFSDDGDNIVFRYFTAGIVSGRKNSVIIDKSKFAGYKTDSKFFGLVISIVLFQRVGPDIAKYPPVYISALTKEQRAKVIWSLKNHSPEE